MEQTKQTCAEQLAEIEAFVASLGVPLEKVGGSIGVGPCHQPSLRFWNPEPVRDQLLELLGKPTQDHSSSLALARWDATKTRRFRVDAYYWFQGTACPTCGR